MSTWSRNHLECVNTWFALRMLEQTRRPFKTAGAQKMKTLLFFNPTSTADTRRDAARTLARQLHNVFVDGLGAGIESGSTRTRAVSGMVAVLVDAKQTVAALAEINDRNYRFLGESDT